MEKHKHNCSYSAKDKQEKKDQSVKDEKKKGTNAPVLDFGSPDSDTALFDILERVSSRK